jgi:DNA repair photolyase
MNRSLPILRGRGTPDDPPNRFERLHIALDPEERGDPGRRTTSYFRDASRSVLTRNTSPDIGFDWSLNPYRGCEHGCVYCYARPTHEYLGFSAGLDFESKIMVKREAPTLLSQALSRPRWRPVPLVMSGVTDPYQPIERRLGITRACLEILAESRHPVAIITKSRMVMRDTDLLEKLARSNAAHVTLSITTLDRRLQRALEPRASPPEHRLEAIRHLSAAGIPVAVNVAPVIPGLTDEEIPAILEEAARAGAGAAGYTVLRLPGAVATLFGDWLEEHFPDRAGKVLSRLRSLRGGQLYDATFGRRMRGEGPFSEQISALFDLGCRKAGLGGRVLELDTAAFRPPAPSPANGVVPTGQLELF